MVVLVRCFEILYLRIQLLSVFRAPGLDLKKNLPSPGTVVMDQFQSSWLDLTLGGQAGLCTRKNT